MNSTWTINEQDQITYLEAMATRHFAGHLKLKQPTNTVELIEYKRARSHLVQDLLQHSENRRTYIASSRKRKPPFKNQFFIYNISNYHNEFLDLEQRATNHLLEIQDRATLCRISISHILGTPTLLGEAYSTTLNNYLVPTLLEFIHLKLEQPSTTLEMVTYRRERRRLMLGLLHDVNRRNVNTVIRKVVDADSWEQDAGAAATPSRRRLLLRYFLF
ncbi:hypothetical protein BCR42DRAFT_394864 [Absidia repens]|uniref:Uncharacterized protein n=1 Tax=Absidia repens TaxID=90262 RepID=A0A1X2I9Z0_9FUNG|nr:hypothetical protein BCR42DRAFT_394864 [Absidia repens]